MPQFKVNSAYTPVADQKQALDKLAEGVDASDRFQTLLGVTGAGKTATMAFTIEQVQRPALVIAHNKTLAAQLCNEFREFFPKNSVEYFVSYGVFLWHLPVAVKLWGEGAGGWLPLGRFLSLTLFTAAIAVAAAALSYYILERPLLRLKYRRTR